MKPLELRRAAAARLAEAGVPSPAYDADALLAHVLDVPPAGLPLVDEVPDDIAERFEALVARRAHREPLQHLLGSTGFRYVDLAVGPGVFVPRPETELLAGWAVDRARVSTGSTTGEGAVVVDLCTGSGAIARAVADEVPAARVYAVELDPAAYEWAARNLADTGVELRLGDMADAFEELERTVDVLTCNPPYIPLDAWESVAPEARDHDPHLALFSGDDGLDALRVVAACAERLLRPGGWVGAEHADVQGESAPAVFAETGWFRDVRDHDDLAGRPRYVTARLAR